MRKQHHFRRIEGGLGVWDVDRLIELSKELTPKRVPLSRIHEFDSVYWFDEGGFRPTCRAVVEHAKLIEAADLSYPIILSAEGFVMDGMHRVAKAVMRGQTEIDAVQFDEDPEPDRVEAPEAQE